MVGITRVQRIHAAAVKGIEAENNRTDRAEGSFPLSDIDWSRTEDNYRLVSSEDWQQSIEAELIAHGIQHHRKDAVLLVDTLYTASPDFFARSPLYIEDGERYLPASLSLKDNALDEWGEDISRDNRDPAAADFMDRLQDISSQVAELAEAVERVESRAEDRIDREDGSFTL